LRQLPELICGFRKRVGAGHTLYSVACSPQAWASGSLLLMTQELLESNSIRPQERSVSTTRIPPSFDQIVLRQLQLNDATVDIELKRSGSHVSMRVLQNIGAVQVSMVVD
jgi:glycogen debranching enzyme